MEDIKKIAKRFRLANSFEEWEETAELYQRELGCLTEDAVAKAIDQDREWLAQAYLDEHPDDPDETVYPSISQ